MTHTATANGTCMRSRGRWNAFNIILMVLGFVVFWPLGLAMLAWIIWGDELGRMFREFKGHFNSSASTPFKPGAFGAGSFGRTGNVAFDDYREAELKRLDEERRKLDEMRAEFEGFLKELRRVKDQEEFSRFMSEYDKKVHGSGDASPEDGDEKPSA